MSYVNNTDRDVVFVKVIGSVKVKFVLFNDATGTH